MSNPKTIAVVGATGAQGRGLVEAILSDPRGEFRARAITRDANSTAAKALNAQGAEVVEANLDDPQSMRRAFEGAYGAFCVTFYWAHMSPVTEITHIQNMAQAASEAGLEHVVWSTLEDTRKWIPLSDDRMPTLMGNFKVPHFDAKGEADRFFVNAGVPTTFFLATFYWDNFIHFGMGPQKTEDGALAITFPMGQEKLAGIAAEDIGKCAYSLFRGGQKYVGKFVGVAGEHLSGDEIAQQLTTALGQTVRYQAVSPEQYRGFGFPGADDIANMFQFYRDFSQVFLASRDVGVTRGLNPNLLTFSKWLEKYGSQIPV